MTHRIESDSMRTVEVPANALYGAQTQRAVNNFNFSNTPLPPAFIQAVAHIKKAAAQTNGELELLDATMAKAIVQASDQLISGAHADQFPVDVFQTGSGTSTNMNVNEVLAHLASEALGQPVGPNDHVNMSQSSNDVIPSAIHISAALAIEHDLQPALEHLQDRKSTRLNSSHVAISYAVFCLK